jgi:proline iminopeptidase
MAIARKFVTGAGLAACIYGCWVRPRLLRWRATGEEVAGPFPHAELVPEGKRSGTMAVTIEASPEQVWPWLVQMGWDRGGWYSWDRLDNAGRPSATEVHKEWQDVAVGDQLSFWALGRRMNAYRVGVLEPNRFLGLYGCTDLRGQWLDPTGRRPASYMEAIWGFLLNELPGGSTRLVVSGYQVFRPKWIERFATDWLLLPVSWIMSARMLAVLKRNIERSTHAQLHPATVPQDGPVQPEDPSAAV